MRTNCGSWMPLPPAADGSFWRSTRSLPDPPPRCVCWKSFVSGAERGGSRRRLDRVEGLTQSASRSNRLSAILLNRAYSSASCRDDIGCITCCLKSPTEKRFRRRDDSGPETLSIPRGSQSPAVSAKSATERHRATPSDTERHRAPPCAPIGHEPAYRAAAPVLLETAQVFPVQLTNVRMRCFAKTFYCTGIRPCTDSP